MAVHAPLAAVAAVLDDFPSYAQLFPQLIRVSGEKQPSGDVVVTWVEEAPVFFVARPKHELIYKITDETPLRKVYRYSLKASRHLKYSEGLIEIHAMGPQLTHFLEVDFYNADWSLLKILGSSKIWRENLKQLILSDLAVKIKAEKMDLPSEKARDLAEKEKIENAIETCIKNKISFNSKNLKSAVEQP